MLSKIKEGNILHQTPTQLHHKFEQLIQPRNNLKTLERPSHSLSLTALNHLFRAFFSSDLMKANFAARQNSSLTLSKLRLFFLVPLLSRRRHPAKRP